MMEVMHKNDFLLRNNFKINSPNLNPFFPRHILFYLNGNRDKIRLKISFKYIWMIFFPSFLVL